MLGKAIEIAPDFIKAYSPFLIFVTPLFVSVYVIFPPFLFFSKTTFLEYPGVSVCPPMVINYHVPSIFELTILSGVQLKITKNALIIMTSFMFIVFYFL